MAENKTKPTFQNPVDFINAVDHKTRRADGLALMELMKRITGHDPVMWGPSIVGFGAYRFKYESGREGNALLLGFSPRKSSSVLYILNKFPGQDDILRRLGKHRTGKVCLYINKLADVDVNVLEEIVSAAWEHVKHRNIDLA